MQGETMKYGQVIPRILSCPNTVLGDNIKKKEV